MKKAPAAKKEAPAPKAKEAKEDNKKEDKDAAEAKPAAAAAAPVKAPSSKGAPLKLGQGLPKIKLEDNTGAEVDVSTLAAEKGVVIFLYPKVSRGRWSRRRRVWWRGPAPTCYTCCSSCLRRSPAPPLASLLTPQADTPGCTNQACGYRDAHDEIAELGYDIYGLSKDSPSAQQKVGSPRSASLTHQWINKKELNYKLLCDPDSQLIKK